MKTRCWLRRIFLAKSTLLCLPFFLTCFSLSAQTGCSCPPLNTCAACSGGLTHLKMEYIPNSTILDMTASDNDGILPFTFVNKQITINSRTSGQPFNGNVTITVTKSPSSNDDDIVVGTSCASSVFVGDHIHNFQVVEAASIAGPICCSDSQMDHVRPSLTACPANIAASASPGECTATVTWAPPTATDNCGNVTVSSTHDPGDVFSVGTTIVTYTATDDYNNTRTCSFNVVVTETSSPVISNCPANISVSTGSSCNAIVTWIEPTANDCSLSSFTSNRAPGAAFSPGETIVTYTATDASNNTATCSFTVTVTDKTPPLFATCPVTVQVNADQSCSAVVNWTVPIATDNCSSASVTSSHTPGTTFALGTTSVLYTAVDAAGNSSQCQFDIVVSDGNAIIANCPVDIEVMADESGQAIATWNEPTVSGVCGNPSLTSTHSSGNAFPVGTTVVTYTLSGNNVITTTCQFNIVVSPIEESFTVIQQVSPNGDGINDTWQMPNIEQFKNNKVILLDRWGGLVYEASGYNNESVVWNGNNMKGMNVPTGTYFYTITVKLNSQEIRRKGFIELIR